MFNIVLANKISYFILWEFRNVVVASTGRRERRENLDPLL